MPKLETDTFTDKADRPGTDEEIVCAISLSVGVFCSSLRPATPPGPPDTIALEVMTEELSTGTTVRFRRVGFVQYAMPLQRKASAMAPPGAQGDEFSGV